MLNTGQTALHLRLLDRRGNLRISQDTIDPSHGFDPHVVVPSAIEAVARKVSPLGGVANLPRIPANATLDLYGKGLEAKEAKNYKQAVQLFEQAAMESPWFTPAVARFAECLQQIQSPAALPAFQWALSRSREAGDRDGQARTLLNWRH